jgi:hypothetical protein
LLLFAGACFAMNGSGTNNDPYVITTCDELFNIKTHLSSNYILGNDINCYTVDRWGDLVGRSFCPISDINGYDTYHYSIIPFSGSYFK